MAIRCVDIADNKRLDSVSPIAGIAFLIDFIVLTSIMDLGIFWLIAVVTTGGFILLFLQHSPRYVFLLWRYLFKHHYLIPNYQDKEFTVDIDQIEPLRKIQESHEIEIED